MALAGAEVIKIEPTGREHLRSRADAGGAAMAFAMLNSNQKSLALDLMSPRGMQILPDLARQPDALVENFSLGTTDRLGIGPASVPEFNPLLIPGSTPGPPKQDPP